jgi:hypothetical protein
LNALGALSIAAQPELTKRNLLYLLYRSVAPLIFKALFVLPKDAFFFIKEIRGSWS